MEKSHCLPGLISHTKAMIFVDGENLSIRYKELLGESAVEPHVCYVADTLVWSGYANIPRHTQCEVIRRYYYTAVQGDENKLDEVITQLKDAGIETPRVFKKQLTVRSHLEEFQTWWEGL